MKRLSALAAALLVASCGRTDQVAGGGSDQPNKIAAGRILADNGDPAAGVSVESWAGKWDPTGSRQMPHPIDSGFTDSAGGWSLHVPDTGDWFVVGRRSGFMTVLTRGQSEGKLEACATYQGTVHVAGGLRLEALWLGGSTGSIPVDASGAFSVLTSPGPKRLWAHVRWNGGSDTILVKDRWLAAGGNEDGIVDIDTGLVLLASAESFPSRSALRGVDFPASDTDDGGWFVDSDNPFYGTSTLFPALFPYGDSAISVDSTGRSYSWTMSLGAPIQVQGGGVLMSWMGVGLRLSRRDLDWSGVHKLLIRIRGTGTLWVQLDAASSATMVGRFGRNLVLAGGNSWTSVEVPVDSLYSRFDTSLQRLPNWNSARGNVRDLAFYAISSTAHFEIKDIRAQGTRVRNW